LGYIYILWQNFATACQVTPKKDGPEKNIKKNWFRLTVASALSISVDDHKIIVPSWFESHCVGLHQHK